MSQWLTRTEIEALLGALSGPPGCNGSEPDKVSAATGKVSVARERADRPPANAAADTGFVPRGRPAPNAEPLATVSLDRLRRALAQWCQTMGTTLEDCTVRPAAGAAWGDDPGVAGREASGTAGVRGDDDWLWFVGLAGRSRGAASAPDACGPRRSAVIWLGLRASDAEVLLRIALGLQQDREPGAVVAWSVAECRVVRAAAFALLRAMVLALAEPAAPDDPCSAGENQSPVGEGEAVGEPAPVDGHAHCDVGECDVECREADGFDAIQATSAGERHAGEVLLETADGSLRYVLVMR